MLKQEAQNNGKFRLAVYQGKVTCFRNNLYVGNSSKFVFLYLLFAHVCGHATMCTCRQIA